MLYRASVHSLEMVQITIQKLNFPFKKWFYERHFWRFGQENLEKIIF